VKLLPVHPLRSGMDLLIEDCEYCAATGIIAEPSAGASAACEYCHGHGRVPVEPIRVLLDYLAGCLKETNR
jgi:hypothetical protein